MILYFLLSLKSQISPWLVNREYEWNDNSNWTKFPKIKGWGIRTKCFWIRLYFSYSSARGLWWVCCHFLVHSIWLPISNMEQWTLEHRTFKCDSVVRNGDSVKIVYRDCRINFNIHRWFIMHMLPRVMPFLVGLLISENQTWL